MTESNARTHIFPICVGCKTLQEGQKKIHKNLSAFNIILHICINGNEITQQHSNYATLLVLERIVLYKVSRFYK